MSLDGNQAPPAAADNDWSPVVMDWWEMPQDEHQQDDQGDAQNEPARGITYVGGPLREPLIEETSDALEPARVVDIAHHTDFVDVAQQKVNTRRPPQQGSRSNENNMPHSQARRYSQFLLHDIQNELNEGDTLIFVDFPAPMNTADSVDCFIYAWNSVRFRMPSEKLLSTGSSKFAEMLNPTYQFRVQRRRKIAKNLPPGIKYVLDLTPPSEGDDLVFQMTEASLTPGIINWWTAFDRHGVDDYVVSGHDDVCSCWKENKADSLNMFIDKISASETTRDENKERDPEMEYAISSAIRESLREVVPENRHTKERGERLYTENKGLAARVLEKKSRGDYTPAPIPSHRRIPDYCPIRHRVNILRLMCIIANKRVFIDSASRVWTLVAVGKILDCTTVVRDLVLQWITSPNNTSFIEVLPEESLQLGVTLKLDHITRSAFRILVNELALEEAAGVNGTPKAAAYTVFGRKRHDPGDDLNNLIQHAARAMVERVSRPVNQLVSETIFDDLQIPEWTRLQNLISMLSSCPDEPVVFRAKISALSVSMSLKNLWENPVVYKMLKKPLDADELIKIDDHRASYVDIHNFNRFEIIYSQFNNVQKALCTFMYKAVGNKPTSLPNVFTSGSSGQLNIYKLTQTMWSHLREVLDEHPEFTRDPAWIAVLNLPPRGLSLMMLAARRDFFGSAGALRHAFDPHAFQKPLQDFLQPFYQECVRADFEIRMNLTPHLLLNLHHNELKFLPLWAGGNDDGTGGVFEHSLPPADYGPAGPGPAYHTGLTIPSDASSTSGSMSSVLMQLRLDGSGSTIGPGSVDVQDGISTVFNPNKVVADDISIRTESFTDGDSDYGIAKLAVPTDDIRAMALNETPDQSDTGTSINFETDNDVDDEVMTEIGPEESRSREHTPEYVVGGSNARMSLSSREGRLPSAEPSSKSTASSSLLDDDDDLVMV
ncbi:hypothetical protein CORC01_09011 [Colletotrichum orchidophilum]|uniref:Uncharacterized protein n=1 Tax=Colletotrichum orchidophilum TaxID=1209926 RepID=A0A1G4B2V7_9PEZI|nr:uncharacterized protein CORC01_09011 [Colletotrichum orchidophilum]OHE95727.1 hypothetical protein CORC01_09011 [Colletotrichum orchidophilum]